MSKHLVIVESPAKAKTIGKILGSSYHVMPSVGHIRDLPTRTIGIDIKNDFTPKYEISPNKKKVVSDLKKAVKSADVIYLAPDPDREGEAIAWHLHEVLSADAKDREFKRVQYNEITPRAVRNAFEHPGEINMNRVNAQQARRVLDRIVGYQTSPVLWRRIRKGLSAGRVQSVALRLVCEREQKIKDFKKEFYWLVGATLKTSKNEVFDARLSRIDGEKAVIGSEEKANEVLADLETRRMVVEDIRTRQMARRPLPPFITSSLQQAASSVLGFSPSRTMSIAQKLYEGVDLGSGAFGLITYMRTDAPAVSNDARNAAHDFILANYGANYYPEKPNFYKSRGNAQEAHEAIRPTDVTVTPESLKDVLEPQDLKLYDLIWRRFVASQMSAASLAQHTVAIDAQATAPAAHKYTFTATSTEVAFDGFMKVMRLDIRKSAALADDKGDNEDEDTDDVERLPELNVGEGLERVKWLSERKETKPPARYSEASLIKALEENGVGRPSTYASIIETLDARKYVTRERRMLAPTELGGTVNECLTTNLDQLFNVGFTAEMEASLDKIEDGGVEWLDYVKTFYADFTSWLDKTKEPPADVAAVKALFDILAGVKEWAPAVKRGRSTYDDKKFVTSLREQFEGGAKPISRKQAESLAKMAVRYGEQLPGVGGQVEKLGFAVAVRDAAVGNAPETSGKLELLLGMELSENDAKFVASINDQAAAGRALTPKQVGALDRILLNNAAKIPDAAAKLAALGIKMGEEDLAPDTESPALIEAISKVTQWREPTKRGRFVYDDKKFVESVIGQFKRNHALSPRQRAALKKVIGRYRDQIPEADEIAPKAEKPVK